MHHPTVRIAHNMVYTTTLLCLGPCACVCVCVSTWVIYSMCTSTSCKERNKTSMKSRIIEFLWVYKNILVFKPS